MNRKFLLALGFLALSSVLSAQSYWIDESHPQRGDQQIKPSRYRSLRLEVNAVRSLFAEAPLESAVGVRNSNTIISIPMPDGSMQSFRFVESPVMMPELQAQFPEIRCYTGQGITDPSATIKFDLTPKGFHGMIIRQNGTVYIDPVSPNDPQYYMSYYKKDFYATTDKVMFELPPVMPEVDADRYDQIIEEKAPKPGKGKGKPGIMGFSMKTPSGAQLRTYRLALACTGEYAQFHGGTVALALAAINTSLNRVNGVYEVENAIRMVLVPNNNLLVYLNGATDPYTNNDGGAMLNQNQTTCDNVIGSANYDIGHVYSTGGGGVAQLNAPCGSGKARGVTGLGAPVGDPFDIDYVCHEIGHQFGGNHTQNNPCNRATSAAYEPGSASTIMGYAGICAPNLQNNSDDYFHNHSFNEIFNFSVNGNGNTCASLSNTGNNPPTVNAGAGGWNIPISTPFELTATASDPNGDPITYNWEQYNLGPATAAGDNTLTNPSGTAPIFRSWPATASPTRVFPRLSDLVNNTTTIGERLPTYTRGMTFRCTVRDNRAGGGGVNDAQVSFNVTNTAGPFIVTAPNTAVTYPGNSFQTVTWDVANTTAAPVSAANVDIFLSLDGGFTYPIALVSGTPNDGSESVLIPAGQTTTARIKVKASNNIFFDISNTNFTIGPAIANLNVDAAIFGVNSPAGDNCTNNFVPEIILGNLGQLNLTSATILYNVNGGANSSFNWTGNLATGASIAVTLPSITTPNGNNVFNVSVTNPNGTTDENLTNNAGSSNFTAVSGGNTLSFTLTTDNYPGETTWTIADNNGVVLFSDGPYAQTQTTFNYTFCVGEGCYQLNVFDSFGDGLQFQGVVGNYTLTDQNGIVLAQMVAGGNFGAQATHDFCVIVDGVPGCTDPTACNFNAEADFNDGSCDYSCFGCTNANACNFNPAATIDNGSCIFPDGCTDPAACNYNPTSICDDGTCDFNAVVWYIDLDGDSYGTNNVVTAPLCQSPCDNTWVVNINGTGWLDETSWTFSDASNVVLSSGGGYPNTQNGGNFTVSASSTNGPFTFAIETQGQFNDNIANWSVSTGGGLQLAAGTIIGGTTASQGGITCSFAPQGGDCDDNNPDVNPGVAENPCNDIDDNCNGAIDENGIDGCTNPVACNYNVNATCENGSCILPDGCTNPVACNFNMAALCDNGSCDYSCFGCTNANACNFNPAATIDNGSCIFPDGCTDPAACNYNPTAICDDGTCDFNAVVWYIDLDGDSYGTNNVVTAPLCQSPCDNTWVVNINGTGWLDEVSWTLVDASNVTLLAGGGYPNTQNGGNFTVSASSTNGPFTFAIETQGQFNDNIANWSVSTGGGLQLAAGTIIGGTTASQGGITCSFAPQGGDCDDNNPDVNPGVAENPCNDIDDNCNGAIDENGIDGCTNPVACNYNVNATCENGSCVLPDGCTNPVACNFNPAALCDNGSCVLPDGCTDSGACNYNSAAVCDNGSCEFLSCAGCTNAAACNYDPTATIDNGLCVAPTVFYADNDGDGFGAGAPILLCAPQAGFVTNANDCDDNNNLVYPGAPGTGDDIDNNCDGNITGDEIEGCFGDFNNDGQINIADMLFLLGDYGCNSNCEADLNGDGVVNTNDSILFLAVFGTSCN